MKFIIDAQLPQRLSRKLVASGFDALHTLDLESGNRTSDESLNQLSIEEKRILVTKDTDFVDSIIVRNEPYRLLLITTGNISNNELEALMLRNFDAIAQGFEEYLFIELNRSTLTFHF